MPDSRLTVAKNKHIRLISQQLAANSSQDTQDGRLDMETLTIMGYPSQFGMFGHAPVYGHV